MSFCLGLLSLELHIPGSHSLKDRRAAVNSLKERIRKRFSVSISEDSGEDLWQRTKLGVACVAATEAAVDQILRDVARLIDSDSRCEAFDTRIEYYA